MESDYRPNGAWNRRRFVSGGGNLGSTKEVKYSLADSLDDMRNQIIDDVICSGVEERRYKLLVSAKRSAFPDGIEIVVLLSPVN